MNNYIGFYLFEPLLQCLDHILLLISHFQAECPHCKGKYSNLSQHIHKVHLKTKNIMCDKCGMTFYHNSNLKKHQDTAHVQNMHAAPPLYPMLGPPHDMVSSKFVNVVVIVISYMWHVACDLWHMTHDMWHAAHGGKWTFSKNFRFRFVSEGVLKHSCFGPPSLMVESLLSTSLPYLV